MDSGVEEVLSPNLYFDANFNIEAVKILPGEYYITSRDMMLVTTLGSCVAACIRDKVSGVGGMNHFMLPDNRLDANQVAGAPARYGAYAMEVLINQLLKIGARRVNLEAKLFGGGSVLRGFTTANVGRRNVDFAIDYLRTERIPIVAQDLLDIYPRKVYFFPHTGKVKMKKLLNVHNDTIVAREQSYSAKLRTADVQGEVELF
ncbi:chemoreceptor glutamine deamidase CheD [Ferriphaselus sp. R-1]|uniref:chemoreceptor glutamine deamidase CheD n=1 Tax=Ferriphaselus sp. R-1 TaxID=1485544 RepID=UPI0005557692|nr:chemoreceptor glutamine deamidase CheD [Ferriphaselus sp. R-1]